MSFSSDRQTTVKLEGWSPSMLFNNLSAGPHKLAYIHKDSAYQIDIRALDGKAPPALAKIISPDSLGALTSVTWVSIGDDAFLVITGRGGCTILNGDASTPVHTFALTDFGVSTEETAAQCIQCATSSYSLGLIFLGTSWGDIIVLKVVKDSVSIFKTLKASSVPVLSLAADERTLVSGDAAGMIVQWDLGSLTSVKTHEGTGQPCTSLALRQELLVAGFTCGHLRLFRVGSTPDTRRVEAEIAAHARAVTAVHMHPGQFTFASVSEDSTVNVWSLPEMASTGRPKVTLDLTVKIPDTMFMGAQFARYYGRGGAAHLVCSVYDSHSLRVFLAL